MPGRLVFSTTADGASSPTERMRITSTGAVGIATTSPGSALDVKGTLRLSGSSSGYVGFAPAAAAGSTTYTLPSADGSSGQFLSTNGSGTLSWATGGGGGGSPGGSNTQVQFNNSGAFGGASGLTWNGSLLTANSVVSTLGSYDTGILVLIAASGASRKYNFIFTPGLLSYIFIISTDYEDSVICLKNYGSATITFLSGNITGRFIASSTHDPGKIMVFSSAASYAVSVLGGNSLAPNIKFTVLNCALSSYNREF
jgi:hypothetical protein